MPPRIETPLLAARRRAAAPALIAAALLATGLAACHSSSACKPGGDGSYVNQPYARLSDYCLFEISDAGVTPAPGVLPYDLNTPLFSDYAVKQRTIWMPKGASAQYDPTNVLEFPDGTLITKTFGMPDDLRKSAPLVHWVETRLQMKVSGQWKLYDYLWNDAQDDATLDTTGNVFITHLIDFDGGALTADYLVPSPTQCLLCHESAGTPTPIGPKARELNKDYAYIDGGANQLERWTQVGFLTGAPDASEAPRLAVWNDPGTGTLDQRARAYLEINCAHCHNPDGAAADGGLVLWASESDLSQVGYCKVSASNMAPAGYPYDIVPGDPAHSFLALRVATTEGGLMMPPVGRSLEDEAGAQLVSDWIQSLDGGCP